MIDERELLERELERFHPEPGLVERVQLRGDRKQRRRRTSAGALGIAIAVVLVVAAVSTLRSQEPAPAEPDPTLSPSPTVTEETGSRYTRLPDPPAGWTLPEPMVELGAGYFFVDTATGDAVPLPSSILAIDGAGNFDVSPDGTMILFDNASLSVPANEEPEPGFHQIYVADIDGGAVRQLTDDPVGASQGSWSPDGTKVVYLGGWSRLCCYANPADLTVLDVGTGTTERLLHGPAEHFQDPTFSPDGNTIWFTRVDWNRPHRDDLWAIPSAGGEARPFLEDRGWAQPSPDGTAIAYRYTETWKQAQSGAGTCGSDYSVGWISDADGGNPRLLVPEATNGVRGAFPSGWSPDGSRIAYSEDLVPPEGCGSPDPIWGVSVLDVSTGERILLAYGFAIDWVDDRTLLVRASRTGGG